MKLWVQFAQVWWDRGDEDFHGGISRADLKTSLIGQHGEHWDVEDFDEKESKDKMQVTFTITL